MVRCVGVREKHGPKVGCPARGHSGTEGFEELPSVTLEEMSKVPKMSWSVCHSRVIFAEMGVVEGGVGGGEPSSLLRLARAGCSLSRSDRGSIGFSHRPSRVRTRVSGKEGHWSSCVDHSDGLRLPRTHQGGCGISGGGRQSGGRVARGKMFVAGLYHG